MKKIILRIGGMSCSACSSGLEKYLNKQKGIQSASVNLVLGEATIEYDEKLSLKDIEKYVEEAGFESLGLDDEKKEEPKKSHKLVALIIFTILLVFLLYISMGKMLNLKIISIFDMNIHPYIYLTMMIILTIPFLVYGFDIFKSGLKHALHKMPNMDTLVSLGAITCFGYSLYNSVMFFLGKSMNIHDLYFESSAVIIYFIKLGRFIEGKSKEKTKEALKELVQITPKSALLKTETGSKEVSLDEVKKGDILICKPGHKVAADGKIIKGASHFDEAFITGESLPVKKSKTDFVIAGSMNLDGYIEYEVDKVGRESTISEIVRLVTESSNSKSKVQSLADKICCYFVPSVVIIALITFFGHLLFKYSLSTSLIAGVTVLVTACPCSLGLATPLAIVVSEGICAKNGILVKSSEALEKAYKADTIVFDKTGTLTYGTLKIAKIFNYSEYNDKALLSIIASIEDKSEHPIAKAFVNYQKEHKLSLVEIDNFENISGIGITGVYNKKKIAIGSSKLLESLSIKNEYMKDQEKLTELGNSLVYVIEGKKVIALIGVSDIVRPSAKTAIKKLKKLGKKVIMLTGDNDKTAHIIAKEIGITDVIANVMPKKKSEVISNLMDEGRNVMMIGDGINDAPSLTTATTGVSLSSGTDIATDSSDIILLGDNLEKIISLIKISHKTLSVIKENLFWAFFYNTCMLVIATGLLSSLGIKLDVMFASLAMMISSLTVVFNSLRLKLWREKK